jgi:hypothetical protein
MIIVMTAYILIVSRVGHNNAYAVRVDTYPTLRQCAEAGKAWQGEDTTYKGWACLPAPRAEEPKK